MKERRSKQATADVRELAQKCGPHSMEELARLARNAESETVRIGATFRYA
jgi:hypothetical protein